VESLKQDGLRLTKVRTALIRLLVLAQEPLTEQSIRTQLINSGLRPNKTTVYRQLKSLLKLGMVSAIEFGDGKSRYELSGIEHHHHLVCLECKKVENIKLSDNFARMEKRLSRTRGFKMTGHILEFFGLCKNCVQRG
jgi:Fe2+ or Zn2+ uptake regulation protein